MYAAAVTPTTKCIIPSPHHSVRRVTWWDDGSRGQRPSATPASAPAADTYVSAQATHGTQEPSGQAGCEPGKAVQCVQHQPGVTSHQLVEMREATAARDELKPGSTALDWFKGWQARMAKHAMCPRAKVKSAPVRVGLPSGVQSIIDQVRSEAAERLSLKHRTREWWERQGHSRADNLMQQKVGQVPVRCTKADGSGQLPFVEPTDTPPPIRKAMASLTAHQAMANAWATCEAEWEEEDLPTHMARGVTTRETRDCFTAYDAFCGVGGGHAALTAAGARVVGAFERCPITRKTYFSNTGLQPHGDFYELRECDLPAKGTVDVLLSGAPCQGYSVAGRRLGAKHESGRLMLDQLRLLAWMQPRVAVFEQVPNFVSMEGGRLALKFFKGLSRAGYVCSTEVLCSSRFRAPQKRQRLYVVATLAKVACSSFHFPSGDEEIIPIRSVLEPIHKVMHMLIPEDRVQRIATKQRDPRALAQVGWVDGSGRGRQVYSANHLACTQKCTGEGPGKWTGVYDTVHGVRPLLPREQWRAQQLPDEYTIDDNDAMAYRQGGNSMSVGVVRAILLEVKGQILRPARAARRRADGLPTEVAALAMAVAVATAMRASARAKAAAARCAQLVKYHARCAADPRPPCDGLVANVFARTQLGCYARLWLESRRARQALARVRDEHGEMEYTKAAAMASRGLRMKRRTAQGKDAGTMHLFWRWHPEVQADMRNDLLLPFLRMPPRFLGENYATARHTKVDDEFHRLYTELGYIEGPFEASDKDDLSVLNSIAAVKKRNSEKIRVVVDFSASGCNSHSVPPKFYLPTADDVASRLYEGCWMAKVDLRDMFHVHRVRRGHRKVLGMQHPYTGDNMRYTRLPFGYNNCPHIACRHVSYAMSDAKYLPSFDGRLVLNIPTRAVYDAPPWYAPLVQNSGQHGHAQDSQATDTSMPKLFKLDAGGVAANDVIFFVDDGLVVGPTREKCQAGLTQLIWLLESLGYGVAHNKTEGPSQQMDFIGLGFDSVSAGDGVSITLPEEKRAMAQAEVEDLVRTSTGPGVSPRRRVHRQALASTVGRLMFVSKAVKSGRVFLRRLYHALHSMHLPVADRPVHTNYDVDVELTDGAMRDLLWWREALATCQSRVLWRKRNVSVHTAYTDASGYGHGSSFESPTALDPHRMEFTHGEWPGRLSHFSSNARELSTIVMSVRDNVDKLRGCLVTYMTDNAVSVAAINNATVNSDRLMNFVRQLKQMEAAHGFEVRAVHLRGKWMCQQGTDSLSRSTPWTGQLGPSPVGHSTFTPEMWPHVPLTEEQWVTVQPYITADTVNMLDPSHWSARATAGRDSFWHPPASLAREALQVAIQAQLQQPFTTSATFVVPATSVREYANLMRYFVHTHTVAPAKEKPGYHPYLVLRMEPGDGVQPRTRQQEEVARSKPPTDDELLDLLGLVGM